MKSCGGGKNYQACVFNFTREEGKNAPSQERGFSAKKKALKKDA